MNKTLQTPIPEDRMTGPELHQWANENNVPNNCDPLEMKHVIVLALGIVIALCIFGGGMFLIITHRI